MRNGLTSPFLILLALLLLLGACGEDGAALRRQLAELERQNRADSVMRNDSLAEHLVDYFDRHGTPNERMRAYYMLGRTYYDLGELPHALEVYYQAADCADTTAADCDYKTLSRVHAQMAEVFNRQVQPRSQLKELDLSQYYAKKANDTIMAIECVNLKAGSYEFMHQYDSVIIKAEHASRLYAEANMEDMAARVLYKTILPLLHKGEIRKAKQRIDIYDKGSGLVDDDGNIAKGLEVYYYVKGEYYLKANDLDSAEYMFRKELREGKDLNNQIAGSKGLQEVYKQRKMPDSIAKYADMGYTLNDSAYSLSEMQNIQLLQTSYNYGHARLLAEQNKLKTERLKNILLVVLVLIAVSAIVVMKKFRSLNKFALDYRLKTAPVTSRLREMARSNPPQMPSYEDWKELRKLVEKEIPSFSKVVNASPHILSDMEYDVCLMTRVYILPTEMSRLKKCSPSHISNIRKRLLSIVFGIEGGSEDFDEHIKSIVA